MRFTSPGRFHCDAAAVRRMIWEAKREGFVPMSERPKFDECSESIAGELMVKTDDSATGWLGPIISAGPRLAPVDVKLGLRSKPSSLLASDRWAVAEKDGVPWLVLCPDDKHLWDELIEAERAKRSA